MNEVQVWIVTHHYLPCNWTHPYPITLLSIGSGYFQTKPSSIWIPQQFSNLVIIHLPAYEDGTDSVPKRRYIKFIQWGITQKKTYNIQNTEKV
jgi:hypothetical protein